MTKKYSIFWCGLGVWFLVGGILGLCGAWTATSEVIPRIFLKGLGLLIFGSGTFGAVAFIGIGIKEWKLKA